MQAEPGTQVKAEVLKHKRFTAEPPEPNSPAWSIQSKARVVTAAGDVTCVVVFRRGVYLTNFHFTESKKKAFKHRIIKT